MRRAISPLFEYIKLRSSYLLSVSLPSLGAPNSTELARANPSTHKADPVRVFPCLIKGLEFFIVEIGFIALSANMTAPEIRITLGTP